MNNHIYIKALQLVERSFTCVLGTISEDAYPNLKAMIKTASVGLREFWFCSNTSSNRVKQIIANSKASLYFYDEKSFEGLMLVGIAEVSYDNDKRKAFWHEDMKIYYPLGYRDPDFALIKFTAEKGNYYHQLTNSNFNIEED